MIKALSLFLLGVIANEETKMNDDQTAQRAKKTWKDPAGTERHIQDGICSLTLNTPHRPFPTLSFCFRDS
jgi:hypothetical protein